MELSPDIREVERYLGYHGVVPDEETLRGIRECIRDLQEAVTPVFYKSGAPVCQKRDGWRCFGCAVRVRRSVSGGRAGHML